MDNSSFQVDIDGVTIMNFTFVCIVLPKITHILTKEQVDTKPLCFYCNKKFKNLVPFAITLIIKYVPNSKQVNFEEVLAMNNTSDFVKLLLAPIPILAYPCPEIPIPSHPAYSTTVLHPSQMAFCV